jgi:hypothetical protein
MSEKKASPAKHETASVHRDTGSIRNVGHEPTSTVKTAQPEIVDAGMNDTTDYSLSNAKKDIASFFRRKSA